MSKVHPTAIVHPEAQLHETVEVGPYAIVGPKVRVGAESRIGAHAVIDGRTTLGQRNRVFHFASVGAVEHPISLAERGPPTKSGVPLRFGRSRAARLEICG